MTTQLNTEVRDFADRIKALGFKVYIAERGTYGFITDDTASRVLSFSFNDSGSLSGNYGPPSKASGTGWQLEQSPWGLKTRDQVRDALYATPPAFRGNGWKHCTTVEQHLAMYGLSSRYSEV